jgi:hypothetical protein
MMSVITLPGLAVGGNTIGMVPYNLTRDMVNNFDRFGGNQPSIITSEYVTLPYIPGTTGISIDFTAAGIVTEESYFSAKSGLNMPWGAVVGTVNVGDYVKATPSGRLTKWDRANDKADQIVGQILAADMNQEQWGWLKWVMWNEQARNEDNAYINKSGTSSLPSDQGYPFDPNYELGNTTFQQYQSRYVTDPTGIPGLHDGSGNYDGFGRNDTTYTNTFAAVTAVTVDTTTNYVLTDYAGNRLQNIRAIDSVTIGGTAIDLTNDVKIVDAKNGVISITRHNAGPVGAVVVTFRAYHYGTSSYLDFKGVVGSYNILLKK